MKKLVAVLAALLMVLGVSAALAEDAEVPTYTCGDYEYQLLDDGTAMITDYNGNTRELEIPSELDGYTVTSIGDKAFASHWSIDSVNIPASITSLGYMPFSNCGSLSNFFVSPDSPTFAAIDGVLFEKASKTLLYFPMAHETTNYTIPMGIVLIGDNAFLSCHNLTSIVIPDSVISIGNAAFSSCVNLSSITIPNSVISIGDRAFDACAITSITIPNSVVSIGDSAFSRTKLSTIYIPNSVSILEANPFSWCSTLNKIVVSSDHPSLTFIDNSLIDKSSQTLVCYLYSATAETYTVPLEIRIIGNDAFEYCKTLINVTLPNGMTSIGDGAFRGCGSLSSINIPPLVTSIGAEAFSWCSSLTFLIIPASVTSIGEDAFSNCPNLTLTVSRDSYAAQWCKDNGAPYTYPDANDWLNN